jgi:hypothetical protein
VLQSLKALVGEDQRVLPGEVKEIAKVAFGEAARWDALHKLTSQ